jgi:hypothetical protein
MRLARLGSSPTRSVMSSLSDDDVLARSLLSAGGVGEATGEREPDVWAALIESLAPYRTAAGGYVLKNEWHFLVATA